jgi:MoxR-like ATPase
MAMEPTHRFPSALRMRAALKEWLRYSGHELTRQEIVAFLQERAGAIISEREMVIGEALREH